jgi:hypothetical protein
MSTTTGDRSGATPLEDTGRVDREEDVSWYDNYIVLLSAAIVLAAGRRDHAERAGEATREER